MKYKSHFFKFFIATAILTLFFSYHYKMENGLDKNITESIIGEVTNDNNVHLKKTDTTSIMENNQADQEKLKTHLFHSNKSNDMTKDKIFFEEKKETIGHQFQEAGVDSSMLEKFEQDLSAYGNQLGAYNGFKIEKKLDDIYHEIANSSQNMEFTIIDPYGNKVLFSDCYGQGSSLNRVMIDHEYKTIKGQIRYCEDNNTNDTLRIRVYKIYKESNGENYNQKYLLSYNVENKDANIYYAGFTNDESTSGVVGEVNRGFFSHY